MPFEYAPLIERYGYVATFVGSIIEGETLLVLSGLAAHRHYLSLPAVIVVGAVGGAVGDMVFFLLGRRYGADVLQRFPRFAPPAVRVYTMIERHPALTIVAVRFMYGLRTAGPAIIGSTRVPIVEFALFNAVGALAWSSCWAGAGYMLGEVAEALLGDLARIERQVFAAALLLVVLGVGAYRLCTRERGGRAKADQGRRNPA